MSGNNLLKNNVIWEPYNGQDLNLTDFAHIFIIRTDAYPDILTHFEGNLSTEELGKADRFIHPPDRTNFIVRRSLLRQLLGHVLATSPAGITFQYRYNRKPALNGVEFNVSHSRNYAVIAISRTVIGIDIESADPDFMFSDIVAGHFSAAESSFVEEAGSKPLNFYTIWTRKEALLKATGEGLTDSLSEIETLRPELIRNQTKYLLRSVRINDGHLISIASACPGGELKFWLVEKPISF